MHLGGLSCHKMIDDISGTHQKVTKCGRVNMPMTDQSHVHCGNQLNIHPEKRTQALIKSKEYQVFISH